MEFYFLSTVVEHSPLSQHHNFFSLHPPRRAAGCVWGRRSEFAPPLIQPAAPAWTFSCCCTHDLVGKGQLAEVPVPEKRQRSGRSGHHGGTAAERRRRGAIQPSAVGRRSEQALPAPRRQRPTRRAAPHCLPADPGSGKRVRRGACSSELLRVLTCRAACARLACASPRPANPRSTARVLHSRGMLDRVSRALSPPPPPPPAPLPPTASPVILATPAGQKNVNRRLSDPNTRTPFLGQANDRIVGAPSDSSLTELSHAEQALLEQGDAFADLVRSLPRGNHAALRTAHTDASRHACLDIYGC